jgi:ATP-dependent helicase HrpB
VDRNRLPILDVEPDIVSAVSASGRVIISAPTGSGKSTQVPQILADRGLLGSGQVVVLQPRRLAARLLAARVARERDGRLGDEVGYQVRFENVSGPHTRIKYETEGILLRRLIRNPDLQGISAILFDEFHERHLYGDLTLARARILQTSSRPDLKIVVMSATLDAGAVAAYLDPCREVSSQGRTYPVDLAYLPRKIQPDRTSIWQAAADAFQQLAADGAEGDVLIFMPGAFEIRKTVEAVQRTRAGREAVVLPLHGDLAPRHQDEAVAPQSRRKVVVSTNIAETSLTIDGVRVVIDSGYARIPDYDPHRGINTLFVRKISRASADQRTGRAGRTAPGICARLWTEREHGERPAHEIPEVHRLDLAEAVLNLKAGGVPDVRSFPWFDPPPERTLERAEMLLADLGAMDGETGAITARGRRMQAFPLHPRYARLLLAGEEFGCLREAALIAALTQDRDILVRHPGKDPIERRRDIAGDPAGSDFFVLMSAYGYAERAGFAVSPCREAGIHAQAARQVQIRFRSFLQLAEQIGLEVRHPPPHPDQVRKCILVAFVDHLSKRMDAGTLRCEVVHRRRGDLAKDSVIRAHPLFVPAEIQEIQSHRSSIQVRLSLATGVEEDWLAELFPEAATEDESVEFDATGKRVIAVRRRRFRDLVLTSSPGGPPDPEAAADLFAQAVADGRLTLKQWNQPVEQWILRLNRLRDWCPELGLPALNDSDRRFLLQQLCHGALSAKEIRDRPVWPTLKSWIRPEQQALLDQHAPERIDLPGGRRARIAYAAEGPPKVAARIQDLYEVTSELRIAMGRVRLMIEVLAPNHRPVQITEDLASFWTQTYPAVKRELQRKYPKHEWR